MSPGSTHVAKLRALEALEANALSDKGRARIERHLGTCATCRQSLQGIRVYGRLSERLRNDTPNLDFTKLELALRGEARVVSRRRKLRAALPLLAVAAALAVAVSSALRGPAPEPTHQPEARSAPIAAPAPSSVPLTASVIALLGQGEVRQADGSRAPLDVQSTVGQADTLALAAGALAEVRIEDDTSLRIEDQAVLGLRTLRSDDIELDLSAGAVTSLVGKRTVHERYRVHALGYRVDVRGTLFRVAVRDARLSVAVDEGHVVITDALGHLVADLIAPATFEHGVTTRRATGLQPPRRVALPLDAWPALTLPALPGVERWSIVGADYPASAVLATRVPAGDVELIATLTDGRERRHIIPVPEGGAVVDEVTLRKSIDIETSTTPRAQSADAASLMHVITRGTPALQRCYERNLKQQASFSGRLVLRFTLDARGRVRSVLAQEPETGLPSDLLTCIRKSATAWRFPAPGGNGITFDAPIRLTRRR